MATETGTPVQRRRKLFVLADQIGLTRDERIEIARVILWRDVVSWKELDDQQVDRMLDVLEGFIVVNWTLTNRAVPPSTRGTVTGPAPDRR
jgi:hypothetical protein